MALYDECRALAPELLASLEHARRSGRLGHAFLIQSGTDRMRGEFAVAVAQLAACPDSRDGRPCSVCRVCRQLADGSYPELHTLTPVGKMYQIQVGDRTNPEPNTLRSFEDRFFLTSTAEAAKKIGVIQDADRMNAEAQNALLKTLEEPPPDTLLLLTSGNPAALLPTTRSRCQPLTLPGNRFEFDFAGSDEVFQALHRLFFETGGDLGRAEEEAAVLIRIAGALGAEAAEKTERDWEPRLAAASRAGDPALVKRLEKQQQNMADGAYMKSRARFLAAVHTWCAELFLLSQGASFADLPNPECFAGNAPSGSVDPERAAAALHEAEDLLYTLRFNVGEELALRTFAVNLAVKQKEGGNNR